MRSGIVLNAGSPRELAELAARAEQAGADRERSLARAHIDAGPPRVS